MYINRNRTKVIDQALLEVPRHLYGAEDLAYAVARLANMFIETRGRKFETISAAVAALDTAADELDEHVLANYVKRGADFKHRVNPEEVFTV